MIEDLKKKQMKSPAHLSVPKPADK